MNNRNGIPILLADNRPVRFQGRRPWPRVIVRKLRVTVSRLEMMQADIDAACADRTARRRTILNTHRSLLFGGMAAQRKIGQAGSGIGGVE